MVKTLKMSAFMVVRKELKEEHGEKKKKMFKHTAALFGIIYCELLFLL